MAKMFCLKCNGSTEYTSTKPLYCSKCGKPFIDSYTDSIKPLQQKAALTPTITQKHRGRLNQIVNNEEFEHPEDATSVPQIDKIECQINVPNLRGNREGGKNVFLSGTPSEAAEVLNKKPKKYTKLSKAQQTKIAQDVRDQFKRDLAVKSRNQGNSIEISP